MTAAGEGVFHRAEAEGPLRPMAHRTGEGVEEDLQDIRAKGSVVSHGGAQPPRKGGHPLADRNFGKDLVHQVGGDIIHPPAETRGAETAAFTAEGHHELVAAPGASEVNEAMLEEAALEVGLELTDDEAREASAGFGLLEEPAANGPSPPDAGRSVPDAAARSRPGERARTRTVWRRIGFMSPAIRQRGEHIAP